MRRDFNEYFVVLQKQYNEMNKTLEKVNKEVMEGHCTNEQRESFQNYFNLIETNYQRVAYVNHLLSKPPKFIQKIQERKLEKEQEKAWKEMMADLESVKSENQESLDNINELLSEVVDSEGLTSEELENE